MIHRTWLTTILITTVAWTDYSGAHFESGVVDTTLTVRFSSMSSATVSNSGLRASFFSPVITALFHAAITKDKDVRAQ